MFVEEKGDTQTKLKRMYQVISNCVEYNFEEHKLESAPFLLHCTHNYQRDTKQAVKNDKDHTLWHLSLSLSPVYHSVLVVVALCMYKMAEIFKRT